MEVKELKIPLNSIYGETLLMREVIRACIKVQCKYSDIPLQDRIYITFGRIVTAGCYDTNEIENIIKMIKSEFEFLEGCWNGKENIIKMIKSEFEFLEGCWNGKEKGQN